MTTRKNDIRTLLAMRDYDIADSYHAANLRETSRRLHISMADLVKFNANFNIDHIDCLHSEAIY